MSDLQKSTMAEKLDFRELIWDSTNETHRLLQTESLPLNKWQCQHLEQKLKDVKDLIQNYTGDRSSGPLKEFYRIAKGAEDLIRNCCSQPWMRAAIAQADNGEAFCEVLYDLEWCITLLQATPASAPQAKRRHGTKSNLQVLAKRRTMIRSVNADASEKDRDELEDRLKGEIQRSHLSHDDLTLAKYLLARVTDAKASKGVEVERPIRGECIGSGSYGEVYKCSWLGETYAEKVFDTEAISERSSDARKHLRKSFEREGHILQSLRHRNVVQLIDHFSNDKECSLVMEYMSSSDLRKLIDSNVSSSSAEGRPPFSLAVAVDILVQMAKGMQYMHAKRVAHRDIKAGNVLVSLVKYSALVEAEGYVNVKLADFGMAKVKQESSMSYHQSTTTLRAIGTFRWKAPELFDHPDPATVDPFAADVYSYGITCSEVMTGLVPFSNAGDNMEKEEFVTRITEMGARPELPEDVCPPALANLISKCWSPVPAYRPSAADIVRYLHDFKASLLFEVEFEYLSWTWNLNPGSIDDNDLSSSDDDLPKFTTVTVAGSAGEVQGRNLSYVGRTGGSPVSGLFLCAKDCVSWLFGGSIGFSTSSSPTSPSTAEITSKDVEITSKDLETKQFPFHKLQAATNNFDKYNRDIYIGEGPFARIFRGSFTGKLQKAAVRKLVFAENSDPKAFLDNVSVMATIEHPNLIKLVGYCENEGHFYLVHEFINSPGTIGNVLLGFSKPEGHPFRDVQWKERYQIAVCVCKALAYLHGLTTPIIHGQLTTRSIMLEEPDLKPKLFDFGMSFLFPKYKNVDNLGPTFSSFESERQQWTAPELKTGRHIKKTAESDIFSFGILMLVLVSGRRVTQDQDPTLPVSIIVAACEIYNEGEVLNFLDSRLPAGSVPSDKMMLIMQVSLLCLQEDPQRRPKASEAVQMLLRKVAIAPERLLNITDRIKQFD